METLLQKVKKIEDDAQQTIQSARDTGAKEMSQLLAQEERVLEDVRQKASVRGDAIIKEKVDAAKGALNALHQEETKSVESIHETAQRNRTQAVEFVINQFRTDYLG